MRVLLVYLWRFWMVILGLFLTITIGAIVYVLSFRKSHYKYCYQFMRLWAKGIFYGMGFRYDLKSLTDQKILKDQQYVIIANHTSIIDIMLTCILFPNHPLCFVGKKELVKIPIFGTIYKRICVMVDRNSAKSRADVYRRCAEKMAEGNSIMIFPEGGVPDDTSIVLDQFKDGAFILSTKHQFPVAVFTFVGLKEMFPFDYKKGYPGKVKVFFNTILCPNLTMSEQKALAFTEIKKTLEKPIS